ncbi:MAG: small subunit ribosomal protein S16 [Candidatus Peregrinibacteria bacterium Greene0416_62]|nr:MAG: small subunit ribosomal protein S16 [Candidatus Peregrinibacteria bacterium Greene0416_62]TSC99585.1 MAG: small subunit ribosomal protein S16 [Candidatus Peregrinibacteria bacterium Greene1014_49]
MLIIRLQRTGRENLPTYRIVVAEKARPVKGGVLEHLGHYLPAANPSSVEIKKERVEYWISKGASASNTVARLLSKNGVKGMEKYITRYTKRRPKNEEPPAAVVAAPAVTAAPVAPAAVEEAKPAA